MQSFKDIKIMLLGITIILAIIVLHMFLESGLLTDLLAIIGVIVVLVGYKDLDNDKKSED